MHTFIIKAVMYESIFDKCFRCHVLQNQALRDQIVALKKELEGERQRAHVEAREQQRIINKLEVMT